ncbi:MAG: bifunctional folylpolyglutamate synthase/dihydrofolate synthase [Gammaproteobacteria bacterium]|nr:bifunctional folylpolyglutamate synthase/dihydrofolate synthase [Gammaproteobacteria bacterium]
MKSPQAALALWMERLNGLDASRIELGLERVRAALGRLDFHAVPFRVATVGGTNGKGSTVTCLAGWLQAAGLGPVGRYTSPHLLDYRERIVVDGRMMAAEQLVEAFEAVEQARGDIPLTYFEFGTLAALEVFRRAGVTHAVLEVGLGGRLDAVNALDADVAAVVSVGLDHQQWLGDDRDSIGREKAGIFRPGRPAVIGDADPPAGLLEAASRQGADVWLRGRDFGIIDAPNGWHYRGRNLSRGPLPEPATGGRLQRGNAAVALALFEALAPEHLPDRDTLARTCGQLRLPGRLDSRQGDVEWLLDVAHNPQAAAMLAAWLKAAPPRRTLAVFAMLADKDAAGVAATVAPAVTRWFLAPLTGRRGQSAAELASKTADTLRAPVLCENMASALRAALQSARGGDRIVVFGSFHTVEEALATGLIPDQEAPCAIA